MAVNALYIDSEEEAPWTITKESKMNFEINQVVEKLFNPGKNFTVEMIFNEKIRICSDGICEHVHYSDLKILQSAKNLTTDNSYVRWTRGNKLFLVMNMDMATHKVSKILKRSKQSIYNMKSDLKKQTP